MTGKNKNPVGKPRLYDEPQPMATYSLRLPLARRRWLAGRPWGKAKTASQLIRELLDRYFPI